MNRSRRQHRTGLIISAILNCFALTLTTASAQFGVPISGPTPVNDDAYSDTEHDVAGRPRIVADGNGTWIAVWASSKTFNSTVETDKNIVFAKSIDNGRSWWG